MKIWNHYGKKLKNFMMTAHDTEDETTETETETDDGGDGDGETSTPER